MTSVLVIDDDANHAEAMGEALERLGHEVTVHRSGREGLAAVREGGFDVVLTDLRMAGVDGMQILAAAKEHGEPEVVILTGHGSVSSAVAAMAAGAAHYLTKPVNVTELEQVLARIVERQRLKRRNSELEARLDERYGFDRILGSSPPMQAIFRIMRQVAPTDVTVLITGESGTGKELVAQAIHQNSRRRNGPLVALNCAALPESLLESELFGYEKGAFTGALARKVGYIENAQGGTLFLDEVGEMPLTTQVKLLRVLEQREVARLGSNKPVPVDLRLIAATNKRLLEEVAAGRFRDDLYFRLKVIQIDLPALRERTVDIPVLVDAFVREFGARHGVEVSGVSPEVMRALQGHPWPGNVRELRNVIENMVVIGRNDPLQPSDLPAGFSRPVDPVATGALSLGSLAGLSAEEVERAHLRATLEQVGGHRRKAAEMLGIGERTLFRKIKEYGLQ